MESWNSSNTDNRLSDNSDITTTTKEIVVNDHQHYQIPTTNLNGRKLKFNLRGAPLPRFLEYGSTKIYETFRADRSR